MRAYIRLELRRLTRTPGLLIFAVLMPLLSYLLFTNLNSITGQDKSIAATYSMVSMAGYGAIGALLNYSAGLVVDRSIGWLRQLRLTPLPPVKVVLGKGLAAMAAALLPVFALCGAAVLVQRRAPAGRAMAGDPAAAVAGVAALRAARARAGLLRHEPDRAAVEPARGAVERLVVASC